MFFLFLLILYVLQFRYDRLRVNSLTRSMTYRPAGRSHHPRAVSCTFFSLLVPFAVQSRNDKLCIHSLTHSFSDSPSCGSESPAACCFFRFFSFFLSFRASFSASVLRLCSSSADCTLYKLNSQIIIYLIKMKPASRERSCQKTFKVKTQCGLSPLE